MEIKEFRESFVNKAAVFMGDFLNGGYTKSVMDSIYNTISYELPYHLKNVGLSEAGYMKEYNYIQDWIAERTDFFYSHLAEFYNLGAPRHISIHSKIPNVQFIVNNIAIHKPEFQGMFFEEIPLKVATNDSLTPTPTWNVRIEYSQHNVKEYTVTDSSLEMIFPKDCDHVYITYSDEDIQNSLNDSLEDTTYYNTLTVFDIQGRYLGTFQSVAEASEYISPGIYISVTPAGKSQKIVIGPYH